MPCGEERGHVVVPEMSAWIAHDEENLYGAFLVGATIGVGSVNAGCQRGTVFGCGVTGVD